jgi:hypothetical protein
VDHDGELALAFRRIAETRRQLEASGDIERLEALHERLQVITETVVASVRRLKGEA